MSELETTLLELTTATAVSETEDYIPMVDVSDTTESADGTTKKATVRKILKDKALPSGDIVGTSDEQTLSNKILDDSNNVVEVLKKVYPIGCIYTSTISTNPNTLFGFGTWSAFGSGRTLVGVDTGDGDFDSVEETGGAKTHTLTEGEMPEHTHIQNAHTHTQNAHNHQITVRSGVSAGNDYPQGTSSGTGSNSISANSAATAVNQNTTAVNQNTGGGEAHNNLQPYITVYFYKRQN